MERRGAAVLNVPAAQCLGDEVRLVPGVQLVAEVFDVTLHRARGDAELLRALLGRESASNALKHLALALRQADEIVRLALHVHHWLLVEIPQ